MNIVPAQVFPARWECSVSGGLFVYQGDLAPNIWGSLKTVKPGFGFYFGRNISPKYAIGLVANFANLKGDETKYDNPDYRQYRAFKFTSPLSEVYLKGILNLEPYSSYTLKWKPHVFLGFGMVFLDTKRDYSSFQPAVFGPGSAAVDGLAIDTTVPGNRNQVVIPIGIGVRRFISEDFSIIFEGSYRITDTDYIDGYSEAANPDLNDHYLVFTVGVAYKFGRKSKYSCPVVN
jgi:hypothetical protein